MSDEHILDKIADRVYDFADGWGSVAQIMALVTDYGQERYLQGRDDRSGNPMRDIDAF